MQVTNLQSAAFLDIMGFRPLHLNMHSAPPTKQLYRHRGIRDRVGNSQKHATVLGLVFATHLEPPNPVQSMRSQLLLNT
jgi:hypothetical protein